MRNNLEKNAVGVGTGRTRASLAVVAVTLASALLLAASRPSAADPDGVAPPGSLDVTLGKSVVVESPIPVVRASLANPGVADAVVLSPRQVYVTGAGTGTTNLTLWQSDAEVYKIYTINVHPDLSQLKEQIYQLFPDETGVRVSCSADHIAVSGTVSSSARVSQVLSVAEAYAPGKVVNLLQVGGVQQVMLEVRVAEMNRELIRRLGINIGYVAGGSDTWATTTLNGISAISQQGVFSAASLEKAAPFGFVPVAANAILRFTNNGDDWTVFFDALKENGLAKILAEPTLVALSGQEASFLAGGEFPVPVPQALGTTTILFKKFGVGLNFTPTVLGGNVISMRVAPEVSELDFANAIVLNGFIVPSITTRRASTVVELRDGQSFAIAGLIRESLREKLSKYPMLGDVPILGTLFRSSEFQRQETELIILVTPHLVKPISSGEDTTLPTDDFVEPNDLDFYGFGKIERTSALTPTSAGGAMTVTEEEQRTETRTVTPAPAAPHAASGPVHHSDASPHAFDGDFGHVNP
ncbi:MAG TPA: type II and III secretion system protein family protein [Candidatus Binatia bacterium]|jgi:pilus assembly protein CpaC